MLSCLSVVLLLASDPAMARVREAAYVRVERAKSIAGKPEIVMFALAKNGERESEGEIRRKDKLWIENREYPLRKALTQSACARSLRALVQDDPMIVEAILMDERGALVCASAETSDYWQGDEAKWQRTFVEGREVFVDEPAFDASAGVYAIQVSVPAARNGERIGALTLTLKLPRAVVATSGGLRP